MNKFVVSAVRYGMRQGFRKGVLGGESTWVYLGAVAVAGHLLGKYSGRKEEVIFSEKLKPGEAFTVANLLPQGQEKAKG